MKKTFALLSLLMALMMAVPAQAQVRWGLSGGVSLNNVNLDNAPGIVSRNYTGWYVGPTLEVGLGKLPLKVDASALYHYNGATVGEEHSEPHHVNGNYIAVPVNAKLNIPLGSLTALYVSAGPELDFKMGAKEYRFNIYNPVSPDEVIGTQDYKTKSTQVSFNIGAGLRVFDQFQIGASYNVACTDAADGKFTTMDRGFSYKNNMWKINLLVFF